MKKTRALVCSLILISSGLTSGNAFAVFATEATQIMNNIELVMQYVQQIQDYQQQLKQYETMLRNLASNPAGVQLNNLTQLATNASRLMNYGKDISSSIALIDKKFAETFNNPIAKTFADKFQLWSNSSSDGLKAAMLNAGMQREQFSDEASALQGLVSNLASSQGNLAALQALGSLNARQIQESMKLRDLISQQQVAQNTYLAAQNSKEQARQAQLDYFTQRNTEAIPAMDQTGITVRKLKLPN